MENSRRTKRILRKLDRLQDLLKFYLNGDKKFDKDFREIRDFISDMGLTKKEDHVKFAKKLLKLWNNSNEKDVK
jgi:hypothetical protein